ncbi:hypothetical protein [Oceanobacillus timonensis]|uniref:hypothetical protein n=1 Tax=Oceanobacillus timonensis TaxID=1926285 RepID=UPI0009BA7EA2|nr:hypothetical protein [Oceanobacillus timonensis]
MKKIAIIVLSLVFILAVPLLIVNGVQELQESAQGMGSFINNSTDKAINGEPIPSKEESFSQIGQGTGELLFGLVNFDRTFIDIGLLTTSFITVISFITAPNIKKFYSTLKRVILPF